MVPAHGMAAVARIGPAPDTDERWDTRVFLRDVASLRVTI